MPQRPHSVKELEGFWKIFEQCGFNVCEVHRKHGGSIQTWASRFKSASVTLKRERPKPQNIKSKPNDITDEKALKAWKVYEAHHYKIGQASVAHGMKRSKFEKYLEHARLKLGKKVYGTKPKILLLDIETAPNIAYVWGANKQYINPEWLAATGYILCWTAKWLGEDEVMFKRLQKGKPLSLLGPIHKMLNEAHVVIHYNGKKFDIPTLNKEFLLHGMAPPAPFKQVDCLLTMWNTFLFPANKLDYITKVLGIGEKIRHSGPQLWIDCMADKEEAWKRMEAYNRHDVTLLEKLYVRLLPWIKAHPNIGAMLGVPACPNCGSEEFRRDGAHLAQVMKYERYQCGSCNSWFRGTKTITDRKTPRFAAAV